MTLTTNRAARRRAERDGAQPVPSESRTIQLCNPETANFETFIVKNAATCRRIPQHPKDEPCSNDCTPVVVGDTAKGQHVIICGAGPSLKENADEWCKQGDQVWGCNSAATWLHKNGYKVTHGFTVDQTAAMCQEWVSAPDIEYLVASTVHPHLLEYLVSKGRRTTLFHNFVGVGQRHPPVEVKPGYVMDYEMWMYHELYLPTVVTGWGLNSVTRAIGIAHVMGFEKITVLGADCAIRFKTPPPEGYDVHSPEHAEWLRKETIMHADGGHALASGATPVTLTGIVDGRTWLTKPDMAESARWLVELARTFPKIQLIGDTFPNAIKDKSASFLNRLPRLSDSRGRPVEIDLSS